MSSVPTAAAALEMETVNMLAANICSAPLIVLARLLHPPTPLTMGGDNYEGSAILTSIYTIFAKIITYSIDLKIEEP